MRQAWTPTRSPVAATSQPIGSAIVVPESSLTDGKPKSQTCFLELAAHAALAGKLVSATRCSPCFLRLLPNGTTAETNAPPMPSQHTLRSRCNGTTSSEEALKPGFVIAPMYVSKPMTADGQGITGAPIPKHACNAS